MKRLTIILSVTFVLAISFYGCATMSDVVRDKDKGTHKTYPINMEQAWDIAITVLRWENCETIEQHQNAGYMLTTIGQDFFSDGTLVGVWLDEVDKENTKITVVTKRKEQLNLATGLTETTFHSSYEKAVNIIKKGEKLPFDKPY